ncbi:TPA: hypothetical protein N0F65_008135 [Lagenidium giganteum]|uniref:Phospholipid:diacylglycerol acyltransferase n=1 Tax=Lagenidium giganteum TaxID=4803 RepID=A0AAV2YMG1_9STRA|nr:TPA: hypothetical protein N0F65_008135 [Lagenidium giganteum]
MSTHDRKALVWFIVATVLAVVCAKDAVRPVLFLPGFASSQLHAWKKHSCSHSIQKNLYRDVNVGDRLWIDAARILAQGECWRRCLQLHTANQSEVECKLRAAEGLSAISELDPGLVTGPLSIIWREIIKDLIEHFEFDPAEVIVAPYDWRLPPSVLESRDRYFSSLKWKIEQAITLHGDTGGLVVIAHSMGNNIFRYFLAWLKNEVGINNWQRWIDKHISAFFSIGAPLLGSSEALELVTSGLTQGLPISQREVRKLVVSFGSIIGFLPMPSVPPTSHDTDTLVRIANQIQGTRSLEKNYTSFDIASGQFFRDLAEHDPVFADLEIARKRFFANDNVLDYLVPWERPPIASVYSVYGINLPTKYNYEYKDTDVRGLWYQLALQNEQGHRQVCSKTGDSTVPYHSLSWAHTWLGPNGTLVNVTRVLQSVYFSAESIKRSKAIRRAENHHADYAHATKKSICAVESTAPGIFDGFFGSSASDQITFFETTHEDSETRKRRSTSVWEVDGAGNREILSNRAFLRELRAELRHLFKGQSTSDKTSRPPALDSDCYWNYRQAKCEFPEFCHYRYAFGDVTLDQSCRLRVSKGSSDAITDNFMGSGDDGWASIHPHTCKVPCVYCSRPYIRESP